MRREITDIWFDRMRGVYVINGMAVEGRRNRRKEGRTMSTGEREKKIVNVVNLTPHPISISSGVGSASFPPSGTVCRAEEVVEELGILDVAGVGPVPVRRVSYGQPTGLPEPRPGVVYVVSTVAAHAIARHQPGRDDVFVAYDLVRDESGRIVGARGLARVP